MPDLHDLTALEQAAAIRRGDLDPADLTAHYLARITAFDDRVGAFVRVFDAPPPAAAPRDGQLDALAGVPTAIKDLTPLAGAPTTMGSAAFADWVPGVDGHVVTAAREAGMPILGKTATSEFGAVLYTETGTGPPARNPWRLTDTAGGSSAEPPRRWRRACSRWRTAATAAARCGYRRRCAGFTRPMLAEGDVDPACVAAVDTAAGVLSDLGHEVVGWPPRPRDCFALI